MDWLIAWSFATQRGPAADLATSMLRNGFFHQVNLDISSRVPVLSTDVLLSKHVLDNEDARYVFVSLSFIPSAYIHASACSTLQYSCTYYTCLIYLHSFIPTHLHTLPYHIQCSCTFVYTICTCTCMCPHTHMHTYMYIRTYIHTCWLLLSTQNFKSPYLKAEVVEEIMGWLG